MTGQSERSAWRAGLGLGLLLSVGLLIGFAPSSAAAQEGAAKVEKLFREGVDLYQQGRYSEAQRKLHEVLALEPRKELAARLVDEAGTHLMARMMAEPRMGAEPTRIWEQYRKYYIGKLADKERMAKMAARVVDPATSGDERALLYREFSELGHYAVPVLAPYLKDAQHEDFRTQARIVLARMGPVAVLPVIELLGHKDVLMRENAVLTLADIEPLDERAIPALKARLEDPKETATVKRLATRTLERITGLPASGLKSAAYYYYAAANKYYLERAGVAGEAEQVDGYLWHLNGNGDLIPVLYPLWAWNEQLAEERVLKGMSLDVNQSDYYPLAACIWAAQYQEVKDLVEILKEQPVKHFFSEEEKQTVLAWDKKLVDCRNLVAACGRDYVNAALNKVYRDMKRYRGHPKLPGVGVFLARMLQYLDETGELLPPPALPTLPTPPAPKAAPVVEAPASPPVLTTVEVRPGRAVVAPGQTQQFSATALDQNGKKMEGVKFAWSVDGGGLIDQKGLFTAVGQAGGPWPVYAQAIVEGAEEGQEAAKGEAKAEVAGTPREAGSAPTKPTGPGLGMEADLGPTPTSSALVNGLSNEDQNIQYACALALAHINRFPEPWQGQDEVAKLLGRGVSENQPLQILVVEENHNVRNELRVQIEALGMIQTDAVSGRDAIMKARRFPPKDLVFIGDNLRRDLTPEQLMEELRADVRTRYIPAGILHNQATRKATQARFGTEIPLIEREAKGNDLKVMVEKLEKLRAPESTPKRKAHEVAAACATALSKLDIRATRIRLADAVPHCVKALKNRKDDVRIPSAVAIGQARGGAMVDDAAAKLLAVFTDKNNKLPLRLAALQSIKRVKPAFIKEFLAAQSEADHILQEWAAIDFGTKTRTNKKLYEFLRAKRVDRAKKEK